MEIPGPRIMLPLMRSKSCQSWEVGPVLDLDCSLPASCTCCTCHATGEGRNREIFSLRKQAPSSTRLSATCVMNVYAVGAMPRVEM